MIAHASEAVMLRDTPARSDHGRGGSRGRPILELLTCIGRGTRIAVAVGLLTCWGLPGLWASTSAAPRGLTVQRSTRAIPHRYTVYPNGATVVANQTQHFGVTDAQGRSVAVRWNVTGIGCSGLACGTIDANGVYHTPSSLPQPPIVTLEGVLVSDPNYSVLAEIQLAPALAVPVSPTTIQVFTGKTQPLTAPVLERQNVASRTALPPLPNAVAAAPVVERRNLASNPAVPPPVAVAPGARRDTPAVTYRDGQLTIDAENLTLAAVLELVAQKTGAVIDVPPGTGQERIFEHAGPGRAEEVLAQLLNGSPFDFVIVGASGHPQDLAQVLLFKSGTPVRLPDQTASAQLKTATASVAPPVAIPALMIDPGTLPPKEALTPEVVGQLMHERAQQLREQLQQLQPQQ